MKQATQIQSVMDTIRDEPNNPLAYISASRLKSYLSCSLRFYFEKVLGLSKPSANMHIGKAVHAALQFWNKAEWRGEDTTTDAVIAEYTSSYADMETETPVRYDRKSREECMDAGERVLRAYLDSELVHDKRPVIGVEVGLRSDAVGLALPLVGFVDLVRQNGAPVPVDYKTAGATPNPSDEAWQNEIQMTAYHLLVADATDDTPAPGELVHLVKLKSPKVIRQVLPPVDQVKIDRLKRLVDVYVDGVTRGDYHPAPGWQCRMCSFRNECTSWTGALDKPDALAMAA